MKKEINIEANLHMLEHGTVTYHRKVDGLKLSSLL